MNDQVFNPGDKVMRIYDESDFEHIFNIKGNGNQVEKGVVHCVSVFDFAFKGHNWNAIKLVGFNDPNDNMWEVAACFRKVEDLKSSVEKNENVENLIDIK
jgi:hypothetical protein